MLNLHEKLKARLTTSLAEALPQVEVNNNMFLNSDSRLALIKLDESLPDHGALRDQLSEYVDSDFPAMVFVYDSLQDELAVNEYSQNGLKKLTEVAGFEDAPAHAARLIDAFQSLPRRYVFSIPLPSDVSELFVPFVVDESLGPNIRLVKATKEFAEKYPLDHTDEKRQSKIHGGSLLFPTPANVTYSENRIYLQIETQGFVGSYGGTVPAVRAERLLKSFLGLGLALRLLKVEDVYHMSPPTHSFFVHKADGDGWTIHTKIDFDRDTSRVFDQLRSNDMFTGASKERKLSLAMLIVDELRAVFSAGDKADATTLGAGWLFESYGVQDRRLSYVQSMVVLEVLLGDKAMSDAIGLGQLLRNRCAYLIGKSHEERRTLLKDFDELYAVRSQIVHRGKATLNFKERLLSNKLRDICNRVIQREVDLLRGESK